MCVEAAGAGATATGSGRPAPIAHPSEPPPAAARVGPSVVARSAVQEEEGAHAEDASAEGSHAEVTVHSSRAVAEATGAHAEVAVSGFRAFAEAKGAHADGKVPEAPEPVKEEEEEAHPSDPISHHPVLQWSDAACSTMGLTGQFANLLLLGCRRQLLPNSVWWATPEILSMYEGVRSLTAATQAESYSQCPALVARASTVVISAATVADTDTDPGDEGDQDQDRDQDQNQDQDKDQYQDLNQEHHEK